MDQGEQLNTVCDTYRVERPHRSVPSSAIVRVLGAFGIDISTPGQLAVAAAACADEPWRTMAPPMVVADRPSVHVPIHVFAGDPVSVTLDANGTQIHLTPARGHTTDVETRRVDGVVVERRTYALPTSLPVGFAHLTVTSEGRSQRSLIIVPPMPYARSHSHKGNDTNRDIGMSWELGALASDRSWGIGDWLDARDVAGWAHTMGAQYVYPDPHRLSPQQRWDQPTDGVTFLDPLYLRVEDIDEYAYLSTPDRTLVTWAKDDPAVTRGLRAGNLDDIARAKVRAARVIFNAGLSPARRYQFDAFCVQGGRHLRVYAAWCALVRYSDNPWNPDRFFSLSDPQLNDTAAHFAPDVEFFMWLQWILTRQLAAVHRQLSRHTFGLARPLWLHAAKGSIEEWFVRGTVISGTRNAPGVDTVANTVVCNPLDTERSGLVQLRATVRRVAQHCGAIVIQDPQAFFTSRLTADGHTITIRHDARSRIAAVITEAALAGVHVWANDRDLTQEQRQELTAAGIVVRTMVLGDAGVDASALGRDRDAGRIECVSTWATGPLAARLDGTDLHAVTEVADIGHTPTRQSERAFHRRQLATAVGADPEKNPTAWSLVTDVYRRVAQRGLTDIHLADALGVSTLSVSVGSPTQSVDARSPLSDFPVVLGGYRDSGGALLSVDDVWNSARAAYLVNSLTRGVITDAVSPRQKNTQDAPTEVSESTPPSTRSPA